MNIEIFVYQLAKLLNISNTKAIYILKSKGLEISSPIDSIDSKYYEMLKEEDLSLYVFDTEEELASKEQVNNLNNITKSINETILEDDKENSFIDEDDKPLTKRDLFFKTEDYKKLLKELSESFQFVRRNEFFLCSYFIFNSEEEIKLFLEERYKISILMEIINYKILDILNYIYKQGNLGHSLYFAFIEEIINSKKYEVYHFIMRNDKFKKTFLTNFIYAFFSGDYNELCLELILKSMEIGVKNNDIYNYYLQIKDSYEIDFITESNYIDIDKLKKLQFQIKEYENKYSIKILKKEIDFDNQIIKNELNNILSEDIIDLNQKAENDIELDKLITDYYFSINSYLINKEKVVSLIKLRIANILVNIFNLNEEKIKELINSKVSPFNYSYYEKVEDYLFNTLEYILFSNISNNTNKNLTPTLDEDILLGLDNISSIVGYFTKYDFSNLISFDEVTKDSKLFYKKIKDFSNILKEVEYLTIKLLEYNNPIFATDSSITEKEKNNFEINMRNKKLSYFSEIESFFKTNKIGFSIDEHDKILSLENNLLFEEILNISKKTINLFFDMDIYYFISNSKENKYKFTTEFESLFSNTLLDENLHSSVFKSDKSIYFIFSMINQEYISEIKNNIVNLLENISKIQNNSYYKYLMLDKEKDLNKVLNIKKKNNLKFNTNKSYSKYSYFKNSIGIIIHEISDKCDSVFFNINKNKKNKIEYKVESLYFILKNDHYYISQSEILSKFKSYKSENLNSYIYNNIFCWDNNWIYAGKNLLIKNINTDITNKIIENIKYNALKINYTGNYNRNSNIICPIIFYDIIIGLFVLTREHWHYSESHDTDFKIVSKINSFSNNVWKDLSFDCIDQMTKSLMNIKDYDLSIEKCLNDAFIYSREMAIFPSIYMLTNKDNHLYSEILSIFDNTTNNSVYYHEEELEQNYHLKNFYEILEKYNNTEELTDARTIYIHKLSNNDVNILNKPIILIFVFKTYNFELFQDYFLNNVLDIVKNFIYSYISRQKLLEKESIQAKLFGMLDHSIINDIKVYDRKLNKVIKELKEKNIDDESILDDLNYITSRNLEREKILKATKNLLIPDSTLSNTIDEFYLYQDIKKEIDETKQGKIISVKDEAKEKWEKTNINFDIKEQKIKTLEEYRVFFKFTISELYNNAVKYSPNNKTTSEKKLTHFKSNSYEDLSIKRGRVVFGNSSGRKIEDTLFITNDKDILLKHLENPENINLLSFDNFEMSDKEKYKYFFLVTDDITLYEKYQKLFNISFDPIYLSILDEKENNDDFLVISISNKLTNDAKVKFSSKDNLEKIFEKGERLNAQSSGTGLGLYIIRHILENRLNGNIKTELINNSEWINIKCYINKKDFFR